MDTKILLENGTNELEILEFTVAGNTYGINVAKVTEIINYQPVTPIPNAHPSIEGIFMPRDKMITAIDLKNCLQMGVSEAGGLFIVTNFNKLDSAFHVDNVVGIISGLFKSEVDFASAFGGIGAAFGDAMNQGTPLEGGLLDINYIVLTLLYVIIIILMFVMFSLIVITVLGVVFETAILTAISPVALATLVNTQARSAGISFIKNFAAVSMQWGVLAICFKAYTLISSNLTLDFSAGLDGAGLLMHIFKYATPVLSVVMLAVTVAKSSDITKRALGG